MTTKISSTQAAYFAENDKLRVRRTFAFVCAANFVFYAMGHHGGAALLTLLLAASVISQVKMPDAKVGGSTAPAWLMKSPKIDEDVADRFTSPLFVGRVVAGFLLITAAIGAVL